MANIGGENVTGPRVGGPTPTPKLPLGPARPRGAGRDRTARQAGISRPTAPRAPAPRPGAPPRAGGPGGPPPGVGQPRTPASPAGPPTRGRRPALTSRPRRSPEDIAALGLRTTPSARPAGRTPTTVRPSVPRQPTLRENIDRRNRQLEEAGSFLEKAQRRRNRMRGR